MKKLIASAIVAAAVAVPVVPAAADIPQPAGAKPCPAPYTGVILWVNTAPTGYHEEWFCIH